MFPSIVVLVLVVGLHLFVSLSVPKPLELQNWQGPVDLLRLGLLLAQPVLLAIWLALGTSPARVRVTAAIILASVSLFFARVSSLATGEVTDMYGGGISSQDFLVALSAVLLLLALLWFYCMSARTRFGWRFGLPTQLPQERTLSGRQFSLAEFLIWTTGIAVLLAMGNWLWSVSEAGRPWLRDQLDDNLSMLFIMLFLPALIGLGLAGLFSAAAYADSPRRGRWLRRLVTAAALTAAPTAVCARVLIDWPRFQPGLLLEFAAGYALLLTGLCGMVTGSLAILAAGGWQLVEMEQGSVSREDESPKAARERLLEAIRKSEQTSEMRGMLFHACLFACLTTIALSKALGNSLWGVITFPLVTCVLLSMGSTRSRAWRGCYFGALVGWACGWIVITQSLPRLDFGVELAIVLFFLGLGASLGSLVEAYRLGYRRATRWAALLLLAGLFLCGGLLSALWHFAPRWLEMSERRYPVPTGYPPGEFPLLPDPVPSATAPPSPPAPIPESSPAP